MRQELLSLDITTKLDSTKVIKICYVARLEYYKRQELAIEVLESLITDYKVANVKLTILGSGNDLRKLKRIVEKKSLDNYIDFVPEVDHNKIVDFMKGQDVAMFFYEGGSLGNVLWESGMAGKLLVLINNGDTGKIFEDGKNCIMENDEEDFPQKIAKRLVDLVDKDISYLVLEGRNTVEKNIKTWEERFNKEFKELFDLLSSGD